MKLYIWKHKDHLTFGWDEGIAFAMAESEEEAQALIMKKYFKDHHEKEAKYFMEELSESIEESTLKQLGELNVSNWREWAKLEPKISFGTCEFILLLEVFKEGAKIVDSAYGAFLIGNDS